MPFDSTIGGVRGSVTRASGAWTVLFELGRLGDGSWLWPLVEAGVTGKGGEGAKRGDVGRVKEREVITVVCSVPVCEHTCSAGGYG